MEKISWTDNIDYTLARAKQSGMPVPAGFHSSTVEGAALGWKPRCIPIRKSLSSSTVIWSRSGFTSDRIPKKWSDTTSRGHQRSRSRFRRQRALSHRGFLPTPDFLANSTSVSPTHRSRQAGSMTPRSLPCDRRAVRRQSAAAEALYWAGVSSYKGGGDAAALGATAAAFKDHYSDTAWQEKQHLAA